MNDTPTSKPGHRLEWLVWSALVLTVIAVAIVFVRTRLDESGLRKPLNVLGTVPEFTLTNQFAQTVSLTNLLGHIWVADVIFTTCPVSCERMTQRMHALADDLPARLPVKFVSITANPAFDSPSVLQKYAARHAVNQTRWHFLTGIKRDVYGLSVGGLKFAVLDNEDKSNPENLFIHSTQFVLVDKRGKIRGYFEGTEEEDRQQLLLAVRRLARER